MTRLLDTALDDVLARLGTGESLSACLAHWPQVAEELRPLAETALASRQALSWVEPPSRQAMARLRAGYARQLDHHLAAPWWQPLWRAWPGMRVAAAAAAVVLVLGMLAVGAIARSVDTVPGDALYPVKRLEESARLLFTRDADARTQLEGQFSQERIQEVEALLASGRQAAVEFEGRLERMEGHTWLVEGVPVTVMPGTAIEGEAQTGSEVSVEARALGDGTLEATRIRLRHGAPWPHLTATPVPSGTPYPTPYPTATPHPTADPTGTVYPTGTMRPTAHPTGGPQSTAQATGGPHSTANPMDGPHPTAQPTGGPHATAQPTGGPQSTAQPTGGPGPTAQPTGGPRPTTQPPGGPQPTAEPPGGPHYGGH